MKTGQKSQAEARLEKVVAQLRILLAVERDAVRMAKMYQEQAISESTRDRYDGVENAHTLVLADVEKLLALATGQED